MLIICEIFLHRLQNSASRSIHWGMRRYLHRSYFFVAFCAGFMSGIILARFIAFAPNAAWQIALAIIIATILAAAYFFPRRFFIVLCFLAGAGVGFMRGKGSFLSRIDEVFTMKTWFSDRIKTVLSENVANLGIAYLLGIKSNLPGAFQDSLQVAGLSHVVVASGTHLSILVNATRKIFGKISRRVGLIFSLLFIFSFMAVVDFSPSIMRAGLTSILTLIASYYGRKFSPTRIILIVMTATILFEPAFLTNLGWQLSFASFGGIMLLSPRLTHFFFGNAPPGFIAKMLIATTSVTIMTAPISLFNFGSLSLLSFVTNLIILPTLPIVMGLTFGVGILGPVPFLGSLVGGLATLLINFHIGAIEFFGSINSFLIQIPAKCPAVFLLYLPVIICLIRQKQIKMVKLDKINWRKHVRTQ